MRVFGTCLVAMLSTGCQNLVSSATPDFETDTQLANVPGDPNPPGAPNTPGTPPPGIPPGFDDPLDDCPPPLGLEETDRIRRALATHCAGCHIRGEKGYFASLDAFVSLLVANERLVSPGDPDGSELVALLEGSGAGSVSQMPLAGAPYASLASAELTMAEIRSWIDELGAVQVSPLPDANAPTVNRLRAEHLSEPLMSLLGLSVEELTTPSSEHGVPMLDARTEDFVNLSPDQAPPPRNGDEKRVHFGLGGGSAAESITSDLGASGTFVQFIVPLSQRWCERSVAKADSPLFTAANASTGSSNLAEVRENIASMHLAILSEPASDDDLDRFVNSLFIPLESESGSTERAWVGVCSALIRDPRFIFY